MNENSKDLPWVEKIEPSNSKNFTLSLHVEYQNEQYARVKAFDQTKLKLPAGLMAAWDGRREKEIQVNKTVTESAYTKRLEEPYGGSQIAAFDEETANIRGLLEDLSKQTTDVTALGLTDAVTRLGALNTEFINLRAERRVEPLEGDLPNSRVVRAETDAAYETVCCYIEAAFLYAATDEDRKAIANLIKELNKTTAAYKTTHRMKAAQRKPKDPKDPKLPKEPKPNTPKPDDKPDIKHPEEGPKKPDPKKPEEGGGKKPEGGGTGGDPDIRLPEE